MLDHKCLDSSEISSFAALGEIGEGARCSVAAFIGVTTSRPLNANSLCQRSMKLGVATRGSCSCGPSTSSSFLNVYLTSPTTSYKARYLALICKHTASGSNVIIGRICKPARLQRSKVSSWLPIEITSCEVSMSFVARSSPDFPCTPITPNARGCDSSTHPLASSRVRTGALRRSASSRISLPAFTPRCPTAITTLPLPRPQAARSSDATFLMT
mmetsp:Transcript_36395/g.83995  ORF Transcript_36395/g.83995 Transcript_36395/m.83995 type:complete len:214 (+) Transcript_36395:797-1438(+)